MKLIKLLYKVVEETESFFSKSKKML